jgi:protocatechuate 3,4-dioxygenase beta subunit
MHLRLLVVCSCILPLCGQAPQATVPPPAKADEKPATVSGKTVSAAGQPLRKTTLTLRSSGSMTNGQAMPNPYTTTSDAEGKFIFEAVEPGKYMLSADRAGYQRMNYGSRRGLFGGTLFSLKPGQVTTADLTLNPEIVISGKVVDADGDPVPRTQLRVWRNMYVNGGKRLITAGFAQTDDSGEYKVQSMGPGKYYVSANPPRDQFFGQSARSAAPAPAAGQPAKQEEAALITYYPGVTEQTAATVIELKDGHDQRGMDITLRKSAVYHVRGKVAGQLPADRAQLRIMTVPRSATFLDMMGQALSPIGKDGTFDLSPVGPGSYNVALVQMMGIFKSLGMTPADVANHDVNDLTLMVEAPIDLTGQMKVEKAAGAVDDPAKPNAAPPTTRITFQVLDQPQMNTPNASVDDTGAFKLTGLVPARYRLYAYSLPPDSWVKSIRYGDQDVLQNGLTLPPGGGMTPVEILLGAKAATVEGTVTDAEGKPVVSSTISLVPDPIQPDRYDLFHQANTDKDGHFSINQVAPGKYRAYAWDDLEPGNQFDPEFMKLYETKGSKLDLAESATPQVTLTVIKQ